MYNSKIFEIFKNPSNAGGLQGANGIGKYIDESCGDFVKIYLKIDQDQRIEEARFKTMGQVGSIVASSVLCKEVVDLTLAEALELDATDIIAITGEYPEDRVFTINFAIEALKLAIKDYLEKQENEGKPKKRGRKPLKENSQNSEMTETEEYGDFDDEKETFYQDEDEIKATQEGTEIQEETENKNFEVGDIFTAKYFNSLKVETSSNTEDSTEDSMEEEGLEEEDEFDNEETYEEKDLDDNYDDEDYYEAFENSLIEEEELELPKSKNLDCVDKFIEESRLKAEEQAQEAISSREKVTITKTTEETVNIKATRMVEESKTYIPVIETKIISDEELAKKEPKQEKIENETEKNQVSKAKALFDSMFEE